jgi:hypothetical protein
MGKRGPVFFQIPVELRFVVTVQLPALPESGQYMSRPYGLSPAEGKELRDEAEAIAWEFLERKIDVGGGEAIAAHVEEWELTRGGRSGVKSRRGR